MQTHVAGAEVDLRSLAQVAESCGAPASVVEQVLQANTARHFQELMMEYNLLAVFPAICERARQVSLKYINYKADVDVLMCDFDGSFLGYAGERDIK
jgi:cobalt-precorrin-5B (C1)-methyltransferase